MIVVWNASEPRLTTEHPVIVKVDVRLALDVFGIERRIAIEGLICRRLLMYCKKRLANALMIRFCFLVSLHFVMSLTPGVRQEG